MEGRNTKCLGKEAGRASAEILPSTHINRTRTHRGGGERARAPNRKGGHPNKTKKEETGKSYHPARMNLLRGTATIENGGKMWGKKKTVKSGGANRNERSDAPKHPSHSTPDNMPSPRRYKRQRMGGGVKIRKRGHFADAFPPSKSKPPNPMRGPKKKKSCSAGEACTKATEREAPAAEESASSRPARVKDSSSYLHRRKGAQLRGKKRPPCQTGVGRNSEGNPRQSKSAALIGERPSQATNIKDNKKKKRRGDGGSAAALLAKTADWEARPPGQGPWRFSSQQPFGVPGGRNGGEGKTSSLDTEG